MKLQLVFPIFVLWQLKRVLWRWTSFVITTEVKVEISCSYNQLHCPVHIFEDDKNIFSRERSYRKPCGCCPHYNRASNESCQDMCPGNRQLYKKYAIQEQHFKWAWNAFQRISWRESSQEWLLSFFGNKVKSSVSKRVLQENKAREIFRKTNISYVFVRFRGYEMFVLRKIWRVLFFCNTRFQIFPFALLPMNFTVDKYCVARLEGSQDNPIREYSPNTHKFKRCYSKKNFSYENLLQVSKKDCIMETAELRNLLLKPEYNSQLLVYSAKYENLQFLCQKEKPIGPTMICTMISIKTWKIKKRP